MSLAEMSLPDLIGVLLGFVFTLMIFSYILGDNPLFRIAVNIFIGVAAGYASVIVWYNVLWPELILPLIIGNSSERIIALIPLVLGLLLLTKASTRLSGWGTLPVIFLVGVGAATAIGGAVLGTLWPQVLASANLFDQSAISAANTGVFLKLAEGALIILGTVTTLAYFQFSTRPRPGQTPTRGVLVDGMAWVGQFFIAITLGAIFAGVYMAALSSLIERSKFLVDFLLPIILPK
jgi:hypothetical protein